MRTPKKVNSLGLLGTCVSFTARQMDRFMNKATKANGRLIRKHIKDHCPDIYESLDLDYYNPFEHQSVKKDGLLIYVHSGIEYVFEYN